MSIALSQGEEWRDWKISEVRSAYKPPPEPANAERYSPFSFKWTSVEYTPAQLLDNFQAYTPFLVMTTQGYMGRDDVLNTVASDEIYWLKGVIKIARVIVVNDYNTYFTVPLNCSQPIVPLKDGNKAGSKTTIRKLLKEGIHKTFMFVGNKKQYVYQGADCGENIKFGALTIVDRYDERYLMGHTLSSGRLYHETSIIPVYMPVTLVIAAAMATGDHAHFYRTMLDMHAFSNAVPKEVAFPTYIKQFEDIMVFGKKPMEGEYDVLAPIRCFSFSKKQAPNSATDLHIYTAIDGERVTPTKAGAENGKDEATAAAPRRDFDAEDREADSVPRSNIAHRSRMGYHVVEVDPREVLVELADVLKNGVIPRTSSVRIVDVGSADGAAPPRTSRAVAAVSTAQPQPPPPPPRPARPQKPAFPGSSSARPLPQYPPTQIPVPPPTQIPVPPTAQIPVPPPAPIPVPPSFGADDEEEVPPHRINTIDEIPGDISPLSTGALGRCLDLLHLSKHRRRFEEEQVDGRLLVELDEAVLQTNFGFSRFEALKLVKFAKGWRPNPTRSTTESSL